MRRARLLPSLAFAAVLLLAIGSLAVFTRIGANEDRADELRQVREDGFALEEEAMSAVADGDLELAREQLHGAEYHERKAQIMAPLEELLTAFDERTSADLAENADERDTLWTILSILTGAMIALSVAGVVLVATGWPRRGA